MKRFKEYNMPNEKDKSVKLKFNRRLIQKAIQISSRAVIEEDPIKMGKLSIACTLLSIAANFVDDPKDSDRLIRIASKLGIF